MGADVGLLEVVAGILLVGAAAVTLWAPRLAAAVSFIGFGVVLSAFWAVMGAPDIALAEAALGAGVTGALFIETVTRHDQTGTREGPWWPGAVAAALLAAALVPSLAATAAATAKAPTADLVEDMLPATGMEHPVTGVLLAFRAYDTLLEVAVLLVAVVVAGSLRSPAAPVTLPHVMLRPFAARLLPVLVVVAAWVLFAGASLPGGAFQSGAIIAGALVLVRLLGLARFSARITRAMAAVGLACFLAFAAIGGATGTWLAIPQSASASLIIGLETVLALSIGVSLAVLVVAVGDEEPGEAAP